MAISLQMLTEQAGGTLVQGDPAALGGPIGTDTRSLRSGDLFLALRGERFDGHDFLEAAFQAGASGWIVERLPAGWRPPAEGVLIRVDDTLTALQQLARAHRLSSAIRPAGITGTNGKTTCRAFLEAAFSVLGPTCSTRGNRNNQIGLPLTLLEISPADRWGVFELGTSQPGEIARLAEICRPEAGLITQIGAGHLEGLGSEQGVMEEKSDLLRALPGTGWAILPSSDPWIDPLRSASPCPVCRVGNDRLADLRWTLQGRQGDGWNARFEDLELGWAAEGWIPGLASHNVQAAGQALALATRWGGNPAEVISAFPGADLPPMRMQLERVAGICWINDAYNANPGSMRAALETAASLPCPGRRAAVIGDMLELGAQRDRYHRQLAGWLSEFPLDALFLCGEACRLTHGVLLESGPDPRRKVLVHAPDVADLRESVLDYLRPGDLVLVKGSRGVGLERLIERTSPRETACGTANG